MRLIPTSMTTTPSESIDPSTSSGTPAAATTMSAPRVFSLKSCARSMANGLPMIFKVQRINLPRDLPFVDMVGTGICTRIPCTDGSSFSSVIRPISSASEAFG